MKSCNYKAGPGWKEQLRHSLSGKVAVLGVGNELKGDDGVGPQVVRQLRESTQAKPFDVGVAPENWVSPVARWKPDTVLVVDAVELGAQPGAIQLVDTRDVSSGGASSHALSLCVWFRLLQQRTKARMILLGVQPGQTQFATGMGHAVQAAVEEIVEFLGELLGDKAMSSKM